jgi:hypothetical protein
MCMRKHIKTNNSKNQIAREIAGKYDNDAVIFETVMIVPFIFKILCTIMYPKTYRTVPCEILCIPLKVQNVHFYIFVPPGTILYPNLAFFF